MIKNANEIDFRSSGMGYLLTDGKGKTDNERYIEAQSNLVKYKSDYDQMFNKETKTAKSKLQQIQNTNTLILELEKTKDLFQPSETCRKQLVRVFAQTRGRYEELQNKYLAKGNARENNSITLLSVVLKKFYKKNKERKFNGFVQGEWDLHDEVEGVITETIDTKSSWSYITFLEAQEKEINPIYETQGQCYMWLTGAEKHTVAYCLVNGTIKYIKDQIRAIAWKYDVLDNDISEDPDYIKAIKQLERNHIFDIDEFMKELRRDNVDFTPLNDVWYDKEKDQYLWEFDIPKNERVYTITFDRDEKKIEVIKKRVIQCREWLNREYFYKYYNQAA